MMLWMAFRLALRSLLRNRMRSALTALGMIIGVSALMVTVMIGEGARAVIAKQIASMGSSMLIVLPGASLQGGGGAGSGRPLFREDVNAIAQVPAVRYVVPVDRTVAHIIHENGNWSTTVFGTTPDYVLLRDWDIQKGRFFTREENETAAKFCVLGQTVVKNIFLEQDPIGETIRVKQMPCEVIGVLATKGQSATGTDQDDVVLLPQLTLRTRVLNQNRQYVGSILVGAASEGELSKAQQEITQILHQRHRLTEEQEDDFTIRNLAELVQTQERIVQTQTTMLRNIAAVALLVGGIGIMNIMLVSVTERTKEIGIRLAIGARERDILLQFLVEALVLSLLGGGIGILIGMGVAYVLTRFGFPAQISVFWISLSFFVSAGIGILFGYYPARKAARLDPIEALRYE